MPTFFYEAFVVYQKNYDKLQCIDQHSLSKLKKKVFNIEISLNKF